jgi:multicomponent K+:H+ antiporter subunit A
VNDSLLIVLALSQFAGAIAAAAAGRRSRAAAAWTAAASLAAGLAILASVASGATAGGFTTTRIQWLPDWGLDIAFRLDGLGLLFCLLILGIGLLVVLYAAYYLPDEDRLGRFYALLLAFAGAMLGIVISENLILMLVFWEVTSLTSFLLIAYKHAAQESRIGARMALAVTGGGGLALLAGVLLLGHAAGSFELTDVLARGEAVRANENYPLILVLILLGAFTKSAQFPFHFWLPHAMSAPTPVSAYLHSATMVKAGVFLLLRFYPVLSGTDLWFVLVSATGAMTFVYGAYVALLKHDFKGLLAYSTISHLGLVTLLVGLDTPQAAVAAVFHVINHAIFKASLFMAAGIVDHECGTRDMRRINGMFRYMPRTALLAIVAAGAMAGVPLANGFLSKEMFFAEAVGHPAFAGAASLLLPIFAVIAGALSVAYSARFVHDVFFNGEPIDLPRTPHEPPGWMRAPVEFLVALVLFVGLLPQFAVGFVLETAAMAVLPGRMPPVELAIWHGLNIPLAMSALAFALGLTYYLRRHHLFLLHERFAPKLSSPVAFERVYRDVALAARAIVSALDREETRGYVLLFVLFAGAFATWAWSGAGVAEIGGSLPGIPVDGAGIAATAALAIAAVGTTILHRRQFVALMFASVVGLVVVLAFVRFGAPDLALTQLSVEVATIVLLLLMLRFVPAEALVEDGRRRQWRDATVAAIAGGGVAALVYAMLTRHFDSISGFHAENAVSGGGGTNIVNVILVDFRGFDTLGEIAVLAMAAFGVNALLGGLRLRPFAKRSVDTADRHPIMLAMLMRPLLPLVLAVSVFILLRGHNLPGGGFIAGLVAAVAVMLQYLAGGIDFAAARIRIDYVRMIAIGLTIAVATGAGSWVFGRPFMTSAFGYLEPPLVGKFEVASAMAFDLGVFVVVLSGVLLVLSELGGLSRRERGTGEGL